MLTSVVVAVDSDLFFSDEIFLDQIEPDPRTLKIEDNQPFSLNQDIFDINESAPDDFPIDNFSTPTNEESLQIMSESASDPSNPFTAFDLPIDDFTSSKCLSTSSLSIRFRAKRATFCSTSDDDPFTLRSDAKAKLTQTEVNEYWCSGLGLLGFANIPVCNNFFDLSENSRPTVEEHLARYIEGGEARFLDDAPAASALGLSPTDFHVILYCDLRKLFSMGSRFSRIPPFAYGIGALIPTRHQ